MPSGPAHADPAPEPGDPVPAPDWMTAADWEAWCDVTAAGDEPPGPDEEEEEPDPEPAGRVSGTAGFAAGGVLDGLPGGSALAFFADAAAGDGDRYAGASDGELDGLIAAWDRVEARRRRRPGPDPRAGVPGHRALRPPVPGSRP